MADLAQLQAPAAAVIKVAAAKAGFTPAVGSTIISGKVNHIDAHAYLYFCIVNHKLHPLPYLPTRRVYLVPSQ